MNVPLVNRYQILARNIDYLKNMGFVGSQTLVIQSSGATYALMVLQLFLNQFDMFFDTALKSFW